MAQKELATWLRIDLEEISELLRRVNAAQVEALGAAALTASRIFVTGQGRSGWIMRMTALRLMQVGLTVHVIGDATTPPIGPGDLLLVASASGETASPVAVARQARAAGAQVALLTVRPNSTLAGLAHHVVPLPGETPKIQVATTTTRLPLATALEQVTLIVLDALVAWLAERRGETQATMMARHANLE